MCVCVCVCVCVVYSSVCACVAEKVRSGSEKRRRRSQASTVAESLWWRGVDRKSECFLLKELPPERAWTKLEPRSGSTSL